MLESSDSDGEGKGRHHNKKNKKESNYFNFKNHILNEFEFNLERTFRPSTRGSIIFSIY